MSKLYPAQPPLKLLAAKPRDGRLDFWRGLCLIDMILVHLVYEGVNFGRFQKLVGEYTRFAAGGFVFVAGLSVSAIYLSRASKSTAGRWKTYLALWRRSFYILCVHFAATLSFVSLDLIRGMRTEAPNLLWTFRDILTFREGGDLLPLYVIMVGVSPILLELLLRKLGWVVAIISIALFLWGQNHIWSFSTPLHQNFPVVLWQMVFTAGLLFGAVLPRYTLLKTSTKTLLAGVSLAATAFFWAADYRSDFGWAYPVLPLVFAKFPLSIGEALRYFSIIFSIISITDLLWTKVHALRITHFTADFGRRSLAVYVVHVWVIGLLGMLAWSRPQWGSWQIFLAIPAVLSLWLVAKIVDWNQNRTRKENLSIRLSQWLPIPTASALAILGLFILRPAVSAPATVLPPKTGFILPDWQSLDNLDDSPPGIQPLDPGAADDIIVC